MAEETEDRTEAATPRRLQKAREAGQVPVSREMPALAGLAAATLVLMMLGPTLAHETARRLQAMLAGIGQWQAAGDVALPLREAALTVALAAAPLALAVLAGSVAVVLLQTGFLIHVEALMPDLARLDPRRGLQRIAGVDGLAQGGRAVAKLAVLGLATWEAFGSEWHRLAQAVFWQPQVLPERLFRPLLHLVLLVLGAQALLTGIDLLWVRMRHSRSMRMSREEVRQESKETDGNPHVKQRLRQLRHARARKRMMAAVPKATVVVTNPTHYAVALAYERGRSAAPRVVAKGVDSAAARIRAVAEEHRVPVVPNPPLARALCRVELDAEIPAEHFQAVAEIIAYVWRLRGRMAARR